MSLLHLIWIKETYAVEGTWCSGGFLAILFFIDVAWLVNRVHFIPYRHTWNVVWPFIHVWAAVYFLELQNRSKMNHHQNLMYISSPQVLLKPAVPEVDHHCSYHGCRSNKKAHPNVLDQWFSNKHLHDRLFFSHFV